MPWLFVASLAFLGYAHYLVWVRRTGRQSARWILGINTFLVAFLWYPRAEVWANHWLAGLP
jgi:hypothetical protein